MTGRKPYHVEVYPRRPRGFYDDPDWRWNVTAPNGRIVAAATEGYRRRIDAVRNLRALFGDRLTLDTSKRGGLVGTLEPAR